MAISSFWSAMTGSTTTYNEKKTQTTPPDRNSQSPIVDKLAAGVGAAKLRAVIALII